MTKTIGMQEMRYINLFEKITRVQTRFCFRYNDTLMFVVPKQMVLKSIGADSKNLKKINEIIGKKVRVVPLPKSDEDIKLFIEKIISPLEIKDVEVKDDEVIISAGMSKAALIGRNKRRLHEMQKIIGDYFEKDLRIV